MSKERRTFKKWDVKTMRHDAHSIEYIVDKYNEAVEYIARITKEKQDTLIRAIEIRDYFEDEYEHWWVMAKLTDKNYNEVNSKLTIAENEVAALKQQLNELHEKYMNALPSDD